ncbi:MAG: hypothetical protein AB1411_07575 [Nitrospirota bacterium]
MLLVWGVSPVLAHQAGGVEIGDYETGSVIGQAFKELPIDVEFIALDSVGGKKVWYPPTAIVNVRDRGSNPVVLKVTNKTSADQGFSLSAGDSYAPPTSLNVRLVLKPGEIKYIGIPTSDLTYVTTGGVLVYKSHVPGADILGGQLMVIK